MPAYIAAHARYCDYRGIVLFEKVGTPAAKAEAETCHRAAIHVQERLVARCTGVPEYDARLGMMERALGRVVADRDPAAARALYESGIRRVEQNYHTNTEQLTGYQPFLKTAYDEYAKLLEDDHQSASAAAFREKAKAIPPLLTPPRR